ncbi:mCG145890, partial [Mus musculus]
VSTKHEDSALADSRQQRCCILRGFPKASSLWSHCVLIAPPQNDRHVFPRKLNQGHSKLKTLSHAPLGNANVLPTSDAEMQMDWITQTQLQA